MIGFYDKMAWGVILGLACMIVGGLVIWAYGAGRYRNNAAHVSSTDPEADAVRAFHGKLSRAFFAYGAVLMVAGAIMFAVTGRNFL